MREQKSKGVTKQGCSGEATKQQNWGLQKKFKNHSKAKQKLRPIYIQELSLSNRTI